jgi:hypothetical protein
VTRLDFVAAMAAQSAETKAGFAEIKAQLDKMMTGAEVAGARQLSPHERMRRDEAVGEIVMDTAPAAQAAARSPVVSMRPMRLQPTRTQSRPMRFDSNPQR